MLQGQNTRLCHNFSIFSILLQARQLARQTARFPSATRRLSGGPDTSADSYHQHQSPAASGVRYRSYSYHQSPASGGGGGQRAATVSSPYMVMDEEAKASPRLYQYQECVYVRNIEIGQNIVHFLVQSYSIFSESIRLCVCHV